MAPRKALPYRVVDLNYVSLYVADYDAATAFYTLIFGDPELVQDEGQLHGWRMGATWLTLFPGKLASHRDGNPRNTEFAVQVTTPEEVDALCGALIDAGAVECMAPSDTWMYEQMRYSCVDDPFGVRIDVYCPISA